MQETKNIYFHFSTNYGTDEISDTGVRKSGICSILQQYNKDSFTYSVKLHDAIEIYLFLNTKSNFSDEMNERMNEARSRLSVNFTYQNEVYLGE